MKEDLYEFAKRHLSWVFIAFVAIVAYVILANKLADIQAQAQKSYAIVDRTIGAEGNDFKTQALFEKAEASQNELKKYNVFQAVLVTIIAGVTALIIMGFVTYGYTKIKFTEEKSVNTYSVLSQIAFGSLILVGLIFASILKSQTPSEISINMIKSFEGYRSMPYRDAVGVWTDGWGNTKNVIPNRPKTKAEATIDLINNLNKFDKGVKSKVQRVLFQHEYDALISFTYNLGSGVLKDQLLREINYGFVNLTRNRMKLYCKAGGKVLNGLVRRREIEASVYSGDCKMIRKYTPYYARCT